MIKSSTLVLLFFFLIMKFDSHCPIPFTVISVYLSNVIIIIDCINNRRRHQQCPAQLPKAEKVESPFNTSTSLAPCRQDEDEDMNQY